MSENTAGKMHDMTVGSPMKLILHFMVPMFLGNVFQQFYNVADSIIAGQFLGVRALAAIGSTGSLMFFVTGWLNGLASGFAILVAQWFGAKEYERMRHYVAMSVYLSIGFAVLMTVGLGAANVPILRLMNYSDEIMPDVKAYMGIIYAGLIVTAAYNALAAFLRALGDSKSPLYFLIISAIINVGLDVAFIIYGGMGVEGCAYATVIAQGISAVLCFFYIVKRYPILHLKKENFAFSLHSCGRLLALGIPMALQFSITAIGTIIVQGAVNTGGMEMISAYTATTRIEGFANSFGDSGSAATSVLVAQNLGAGKKERVRQSFCRSLAL
ncbi:MAG: MATE family efflux transporter, partial [Lachnospiraceae bacterium]|nr:MATE family efflux transporter [Lachnospiraceae bacterium]